MLGRAIIPTATVFTNEFNGISEVNLSNEFLPMPKESDYTTQIQIRSIGTKVVKSAIKFIIKNKDKSIKVVKKVSGKNSS